jgi:cold shock CspA family protein
MGRSKETFHKKEVRKRKEKKKKEKEKKRLERKENEGKGSQDDMIAYVDEFGRITSEPPDPEKKEDVKLEDINIGVPSREMDFESDPVRLGKVTYFNASKGYGFIKDDKTSETVFVHINNVQGDIMEGSSVTFEVEKGPKGLSALQVKLSNP